MKRKRLPAKQTATQHVSRFARVLIRQLVRRHELGIEFVNPNTQQRECWDTFEVRLDNGAVQINLIAYPDALNAGGEIAGLRLHAEQMAAIRQFATMVSDPKSTERLRRWYERDVELGNKHRYPRVGK